MKSASKYSRARLRKYIDREVGQFLSFRYFFNRSNGYVGQEWL